MSLAALCRPVSRREVLLMALVAISPMTVYALERANNDLVVFLLTVVSVALIRKRRAARWSGYALFLFAGLLKYYPLVLLAMIAREQRRDAIGFAAIAFTILAVLTIGNHAEIAAALAIIPKPSYFADSFAAANLAFGLGEILALPFARGIAASLLSYSRSGDGREDLAFGLRHRSGSDRLDDVRGRLPDRRRAFADRLLFRGPERLLSWRLFCADNAGSAAAAPWRRDRRSAPNAIACAGGDNFRNVGRTAASHRAPCSLQAFGSDRWGRASRCFTGLLANWSGGG